MTYPRAHLVDPEGGIYHVCSRCVRRAFLCGDDPETGYNYDHRKDWLEKRILELADIFAVGLYGYAVMSNHYHIVLSVEPARVQEWTDDDIAEKWLTVSPRNQNRSNAAELRQIRKQEMLADPARMAELRKRLSSLSWFMSSLNEPLARLANKEDGCKGRFWEGRFKSQRVLDDAALLACMVYVDLNPVRAGLADELEDCHHTSIARRIDQQADDAPIRQLNAPFPPILSYTLSEYRHLATWTALAQQGKRPISTSAQRSLALANAPNASLWLTHYHPQPNRWQRALGSVQALKDYAAELGQSWIRTCSAHVT